MLAWHVPYLGWRRLPAELSEFEISHFFTLTPEGRRAIRSRYKDMPRLGAALQIGFLTMCGRPLQAFQQVPGDLLEHLAEQLGISAPTIATLRALYRGRRATLYEHQAWAIEFLGMIRFEMTDAPIILGALCDVVRAGIDGDQLLANVRRLLYEHRFVIPGGRRLGSLAQMAVLKVEHEVCAAIERVIPGTVRNRWHDALYEAKNSSATTLIELLQEAPGKFSPQTIARQCEKVKRLLELRVGSAGYAIPQFTPAYMHAHAQRMRRRRPSRFAQLKEPRRTIELVAFMQYSLFEHTDILVRLIDRRVAQLWGRASADAQRVPGDSTAAQVFVARVRAVMANADQSAETRVKEVARLLESLDAGLLRAPSLAARQREILVGRVAQIRPLIEMLLSLDLCSDPPDEWLPLLEAWRRAYNCPWLDLSDRLYPPRSRAWAGFLADPDRERARHAAEAQLLWELRQALRRGSLYIPHSLAYRSRQVLFNVTGTTVRAPVSSRTAGEFIDQLCAHLEVALEHLAEAIWFEDLQIDGTRIHQHPLGVQPVPSDVDDVRNQLYATLPRIHLPELMLDVDAQVRFSWILLGREPASEEELLYLYGALLGHAMDLSAQRLSLMMPGLSISGLTDALELLEETGSLRRANDATVEFLQAHTLAASWGDVRDCAADSMSLDAARHLWLARTDPKRRTWSTATYVHTLARHGIGYDQPITLNQRQAGVAIEGALRQRIAPLQRIFSDTHGSTAWGMALGKGVGLDLCPRLTSFRDRRLHVPRGGRVRIPDALKDVCIADISLNHIEAGWPDFCQIADAVAAGRLSAVLACERHGSAARSLKAHRAGNAMGLLLRTIHQCDTLSIRDFRRESLRLLNHNERTHALQRQIRRAGTGSRRGRRPEELAAQSGALALVTNVVMAWNTHALQATLDRWRKESDRKISSATLRHITPMGFEHINFNGLLIFPLDKHRSRLLPSSAPQPVAAVS